MELGHQSQQIVEQLRQLVQRLRAEGRHDLLLQAITVPGLEELQVEAARSRLKRLHITRDYRILLVENEVSAEGTYQAREVVMTPVHKAVYLFFLNHPEGLEFKKLVDYREEMAEIYRRVKPSAEKESVEETIARLTDPTNNAINEKCSRIRASFMEMLDPYTATYYIISSHTRKHLSSTNRVWYERLKIITLPRELVTWQG